MRNVLILFILIALSLPAKAVYLDFNRHGNPKSNNIIKELAQNKRKMVVDSVVSYFYDVDRDGSQEIIGIVKLKHYFNHEGYNLIVLKKKNSKWHKFESDVYFDPTQPFEINGDEITFSKMSFYYGDKRYKAKIKHNEIKTNSSMGDYFAKRKAHKIEKVTHFTTGNERNEIQVTDFDSQTQKKVKIHYSNLDHKTKHYLDIR